MMTDEDSRLRRYVLGAATDEECAAIEREYFARADAADRVSAAEDDLIDDYLSNGLNHRERERFERHYLSSPNHRTRVAVVRALRQAASASPTVESRSRAPSRGAVAGIAAALVLLASGAMWLAGWPGRSSPAAPAASAGPPAPVGKPSVRVPAPESRTPVIVAVSISPILVRGANEPATARVAIGVDLVRLELEGQPGESPLGPGRAVVRTVDGREVWRGAAAETAAPRRLLARVDVPAGALAPDDYVVELFGAGATGREIERHRYFFRVRTP